MEEIMYMFENLDKVTKAHDFIVDTLSELPDDLALTVLCDIVGYYSIKCDVLTEENALNWYQITKELQSTGKFDNFQKLNKEDN